MKITNLLILLTLLSASLIFNQAQGVLTRSSETILDVQWNPNGNYLARVYANASLDIVSPSGQLVFSLVPDYYTNLYSAKVAWSHDGQSLAAGIGQNIYIWNANSLVIEDIVHVGFTEPIIDIEGLKIAEGIASLEWSFNDLSILTVSISSRLTIWSMTEETFVIDRVIGNNARPYFWVSNNEISNGSQYMNIADGIFHPLDMIGEENLFAISALSKHKTDQQYVALSSYSGNIFILDMVNGVVSQIKGNGKILDLALDIDSRYVIYITETGLIEGVDVDTSQIKTIANLDANLFSVDINPLNKEVIVAGVTSNGLAFSETYVVSELILPSITLTQSDSSTTVTESGATDTYTLALGTQPTADVVINIVGDAQLTVSPSTLTFTPENWDVPQTVTVSAVDDSVIEGAHTAVITHSVVSADVGYNGLAVADVTVTITDNDEPTATSTFTLTPTPMPPTAVPTTVVPPTAIPTTPVPTTPAPTAVPTPGAGWIAFSSNRDGVGSRSIYAARPSDTTAVRLTSDAGVIDRWPAWNHDRTLIAFTRTDSAGNEDIYIKRVTDNSAPVALGSLVNSTKSNGTPSNERQPVWSPNGTQLAYVSDRDGDKEIYVVNIGADLAVSSRTKLTDNAAEDTSPDW